MKVYCNGFWDGFVQNTDGTGFGFFQHILQQVLNTEISVSPTIGDADILLESHFGGSVFFSKSWKYSIFFSGEGLVALPAHADQYTFVLGSQETPRNFVCCPLFLAYEYSKPFTYPEPNTITHIPSKQICCVISSGQLPNRVRYEMLDSFEEKGVHVDRGGRYKNNIGWSVPGYYFETPILDFFKQYKFVLAFENISKPFYMTEKIINPLRAGIIPIYYGSSRITEYINSERIVQITPDTIDQCIAKIKEISENPELYLQIVNKPLFVKSHTQMIKTIIEEMKLILDTSPYCVEIIGNSDLEQSRNKTLQPLIDFYHKNPTYEVWGHNVSTHPLYSKFHIPKHRAGAISLAINHISIMKKYAYKNKYLVVVESDAIPITNFAHVHQAIVGDIESIKNTNVDFVMLGKGCIDSIHHISDKKAPISPTLFVKNTSRCSESYIIGCWRFPELFCQGSLTGLYPSSI